MPSLPTQRIRILLRPTRDLRLPSFPGSALRGVLGAGLRRIAPGRVDDLFRPPAGLGAPFALDATRTRNRIGAGETLEFDIILAGGAVADADLFAGAVAEAAGLGVGPRRVRCAFDRVRRIAPGDPARSSSLRIRFVSPTRLVRDGRVVARFDPYTLARSLVQRIAILSPDRPMAPLVVERPLLERARALEFTQSSSGRWWRRRSSRQERTVPTGGIIGTMDLHEVSAPLHELLATGLEIGVGKGTTIGLGRYRLEPVP